MTRTRLWTAAALVLCAAQAGAVPRLPSSPVLAADAAPFWPEPLPGERAALPALRVAFTAPDPAEQLAALDKVLAMLPQPTRLRGAVQCARGGLQQNLGQNAQAATDECYRINPDQPFAAVKARLDFMSGSPGEGARLLASAIRADPRIALSMNSSVWERLLRQLGYAGRGVDRQQLVLALADTPTAAADAVFYSGLVRAAMLDRMNHDDLTGSEALLPKVIDPEDGLAMLIDRRFEPLWPRLEEWANRDLVIQRDVLERSARAAYHLDPGLDTRNRLAAVLVRTGHLTEGVAVLRSAGDGVTPRADDAFYQGIAAVRLSRYIATSGERDPALVLAPMERMLAGGVTARTSYLQNVVPNLAIDDIALGRPEQAIAVLDRYPSALIGVRTARRTGITLRSAPARSPARRTWLRRRPRMPSSRSAMQTTRQRWQWQPAARRTMRRWPRRGSRRRTIPTRGRTR